MSHIGSETPRFISCKTGQVSVRTKIQRGSFASVFQGQNAAGESVAIKLVDKRQVDPEFVRYISSEMTIVQRLHHENIIEVFDVVEIDQHRISIIMKLAKNGDLLDYINSRPLMTEDDARKIFKQLVSAMEFAHSKGVAHRDLKLDNILLDKDGSGRLKAFVADWGFATYFNPSDRALNDAIGSLPYASPELLLGKRYFGPEIDVWALGVILFTMVAGRLPFGPDGQQSTRANISACRWEAPAHLSTSLRELLRGMLHPNADARLSVFDVAASTWLSAAHEAHAATSPRATASGSGSAIGKMFKMVKGMVAPPPASKIQSVA